MIITEDLARLEKRNTMFAFIGTGFRRVPLKIHNTQPRERIRSDCGAVLRQRLQSLSHLVAGHGSRIKPVPENHCSPDIVAQEGQEGAGEGGQGVEGEEAQVDDGGGNGLFQGALGGGVGGHLRRVEGGRVLAAP